MGITLPTLVAASTLGLNLLSADRIIHGAIVGAKRAVHGSKKAGKVIKKAATGK